MTKRVVSTIGIVGLLVSVLNTATMAQDLLTRNSPTTLNTFRPSLPKGGGRLEDYPTLPTPGTEAPVIEGKMSIAYTGTILLPQPVDMTEVTNDSLVISTSQLLYRDQEQTDLWFEGDLWFEEYLWFDEGSEIANNRQVMEDRDGDGKFEFLFIDKDDDGNWDEAYVDRDGDTKFDEWWLDMDDNGVWDSVRKDTNGDRKFDTGLLDTNGDGKFEEKWDDKGGKNEKVDPGELTHLDPPVSVQGPIFLGEPIK